MTEMRERAPVIDSMEYRQYARRERRITLSRSRISTGWVIVDRRAGQPRRGDIRWFREFGKAVEHVRKLAG